MPRGGRTTAVPDCPPYRFPLPDRYGDYDNNGLNCQTVTHREKNGLPDRPPPYAYRPPVGQWSPQTGLGMPEARFTDRTFLKGQEGSPPIMKLGGSSPMRKGRSLRVTMNKFPEYKEDPWDDKIKAEREENAEQRAKITTVFKPSTGDRDYRTSKNAAANRAFAPQYTSSIVFRPVNLKRG